MKAYYGIVYLKDGSSKKMNISYSREQAERDAHREFERLDRQPTISFKPTRYEVITIEK